MFEATRRGSVDVIHGDSPIDENAIESLAEIAQQIISNRLPQVVIDLSTVPLLNSKGLEWLLDTHEQCLNQGGHLRLAAPGTLCREILDITGVSQELDVFADTNAAVGSFSQ